MMTTKIHLFAVLALLALNAQAADCTEHLQEMAKTGDVILTHQRLVSSVLGDLTGFNGGWLALYETRAYERDQVKLEGEDRDPCGAVEALYKKAHAYVTAKDKK